MYHIPQNLPISCYVTGHSFPPPRPDVWLGAHIPLLCLTRCSTPPGLFAIPACSQPTLRTSHVPSPLQNPSSRYVPATALHPLQERKPAPDNWSKVTAPAYLPSPFLAPPFSTHLLLFANYIISSSLPISPLAHQPQEGKDFVCFHCHINSSMWHIIGP